MPDELDAIARAVQVAVLLAQELGLREADLLTVVRQTWRVRVEPRLQQLDLERVQLRLRQEPVARQ